MTWTSEKPTVPGWYWWRNHALDDECIVRVYDSRYALPKIGGEWSGPLIPPETEEG